MKGLIGLFSHVGAADYSQLAKPFYSSGQAVCRGAGKFLCEVGSSRIAPHEGTREVSFDFGKES